MVDEIANRISSDLNVMLHDGEANTGSFSDGDYFYMNDTVTYAELWKFDIFNDEQTNDRGSRHSVPATPGQFYRGRDDYPNREMA